MGVHKAFSRLTGIIMVVLICLISVSVDVLAAEEYPIEKVNSGYGGVIGYGRNIGGSIYVPLRLLFEATSAEVDYQTAARIITIRRADGAVITMRPGDRQAQISHLGDTQTVTMPAAAQLLNGTTYVPIRFAAENLMCAVEWDNAEKKVLLAKRFATARYAENGKRYTLDFGTNRLYELDEAGNARLLGQPAGAADFLQDNFGSGWNKFIFALEVTETPGGSIVLDWNFDTVDSQMWTLWRLLLTPDGQQNRSVIYRDFFVAGNRFAVCVNGADLWWPEAERVLRLDGATGEALAEYNYQQLLAAMPQAHDFGFMFCDGEYMLLSYQQEANWFSDLPALVNLRTGEVTDLFTELIPEGERSDFHNDHAAPSGSLEFVKAANGVLYFNYKTMNWNETMTQREERELTYKYK